MTSVVEMVALLATISLVAIASAWIVREVKRDGYGMRPAPRGTEDWSALGLPSRPYGA